MEGLVLEALRESCRLCSSNNIDTSQDEPPRRADEAEPSWETELQKFVGLGKLLLSENSGIKVCQMICISNVIIY